jgi:molybdopterin-guanine dinucleotide biosynthesis protein B
VASKSYVFARGLKETYLIWDRQLKFKEMLSHITTQYLIVEGMKELPLPKIIAAKTIDEIDQLLDSTVFAITGIVSSQMTEYKNVPVINSITEIDKLGHLTLQKVFKALPFANDGFCGHCGASCFELTSKILKGEKTRDDCGIKTSQQIKIRFNDEDIPLNEWVQDISFDIITAFCKNLKGYKKGDKVTIEIV